MATMLSPDFPPPSVAAAVASTPPTTPRSHTPLPNPPFSFPAQPPSPSSSPSATASAPPSQPRSYARRPKSMAVSPSDSFLGPKFDLDTRPKRASMLPLPEFSFNPGASLSPAPTPPGHPFLIEPPRSPQSPGLLPHTPPARPPTKHGHRRGGSEFVGGSIRSGDAIAVPAASPGRSDADMTSPSLSPAPARKGHRHRRSGAVSMCSQDLTRIINQAGGTGSGGQGSSAPPPVPSTHTIPELKTDWSFANAQETPTISIINAPPSPKWKPDELPQSQQPYPAIPNPMSDLAECPAEDYIESPLLKPTTDPAQEASNPDQFESKTKVGFSDTLEFIPRPLSMVSNETSSTATARPGHSGSNSVSSVTSIGTPHQPAREAPTSHPSSHPEVNNHGKQSDSRPTTAGAVLEHGQAMPSPADHTSLFPPRRNSIPVLSLSPDALVDEQEVPDLGKSAKRWSFFSRDSPASNPSNRTRSVANYSPAGPTPNFDALSCAASLQLDSHDNFEPEVASLAGQSNCRKSKKQRKVKNWAGTILPRKSKKSKKSKPRFGRKKSRRAPTPPVGVSQPVIVDYESEEEPADFAVINPSPPTVMVEEAANIGGRESWKPPRPATIPDEDPSASMIDLDAALGPFNTPLSRNAEWEASQRAGGLAKRQMHSAAGMSRFTGPGMHYSHRRAESAPEMPPFEGRGGFNRFSSASTMADVFEEDEEDSEDATQARASSEATSGTGTSSTPSATRTPTSEVSEVSDASDVGPSDTKIPSSLALFREGHHASRSLRSDSSSNYMQEEVIPEESTGPGFRGVQGLSQNFGFPQDSPSLSTPSPRGVLRYKDHQSADVSPLQLPATTSLAPVSPFTMSSTSPSPSPRSALTHDQNRISTPPSSMTEDNFQSLLLGEPGPELVRVSMDDIPSLTSSQSTMTRESAFAQAPAHLRRPPRPGERPASFTFTSTAFGRRRSSLASLSRLVSTSHGERSKLSMEVTYDDDTGKRSRSSKTKRLGRMMQFWKTKEDNAV